MKLPEEAKRVFKGIIFDTYQWEQEKFDGSKATFEMLKRPHTVCMIPIVDGEIWVSEELQPGMKEYRNSLFAGRGDPGESELVTAKRELLEEAGLESDDWELYKNYEPYAKIDWTVHVFIVRNCRKVAEQKLDTGGEKINIKKVNFEEFLEFICAENSWVKEFTTDILRMRLNPKKLEEFRKKLFP